MLSRKHFCVVDRAVLGCKQKKNTLLKNDGFCKNYQSKHTILMENNHEKITDTGSVLLCGTHAVSMFKSG